MENTQSTKIQEISVSEFRIKLMSIIERVKQGEVFVITQYNEPLFSISRDNIKFPERQQIEPSVPGDVLTIV